MVLGGDDRRNYSGMVGDRFEYTVFHGSKETSAP